MLGALLGGDCGPNEGAVGLGVGGYRPYGEGTRPGVGGSVPPFKPDEGGERTCCVAKTEGEGTPRPTYGVCGVWGVGAYGLYGGGKPAPVPVTGVLT